MMNLSRDHVPLDRVPTRLHTMEAVTIWHARRVILDSASYLEAARRLGITKKTLWVWRKEHGITDTPSRKEE